MEPKMPPQDNGIPAADPGRGAPPPADGFGVGGEEPDRQEEAVAPVDAAQPSDSPFRTPDPTDVGHQDVSADRLQ